MSLTTEGFSAITLLTNEYYVTNSTTTTLPYEPGGDVLFLIYYYGIFGVLTCINLPGNLLVITTVCRNPLLRQPCNYCIASLAVSDFLIGLVYPVYNIAHLEEVPALRNVLGSWSVCRFLVWQVLTLEICSSYHLVAITVTRYIAIVHPLRYHSFVTTKTVSVTIAVIWVVSQGSGLAMYTLYDPGKPVKVCRYELIFSVTHVAVLLVIQLFVPLMVMLALYVRIAKIARKQAMSIASQESSVTGKIKTKNGIIKSEMKSTIMVSLLLGFFALSWSPMIIYFFYTIACSNPPCTANKYIRATVRVLLYLNSSVNVFIYAGRLIEFRKNLKSDFQRLCSICCKCFKPSDIHQSPTEVNLMSSMSKVATLNDISVIETSKIST